MLDPEDLLGVHEVAQFAGVTSAAVANWRKRFDSFPAPVAELRSGPVFKKSQIRHWLRKRKKPMANIIATINLKGGVGKTTTTVALAEFMSAVHRKKVLVIDLDPQTNATVILVGEDRWAEQNDAGQTLAHLFKDALNEDESQHTFVLEEALLRTVSNVGDVRTVDLLPSSIDLIDVQDRLAGMSGGRFYANNPIEVLGRVTKTVVDEYDYVLIDCPPNLGIVTLNGLRIADGYIIPTIPDVLSTYGIPQIKSRVAAFAQNIGETIEPLGIIVSKYREQSTVHRNTVNRLHKTNIPVFETFIPESNQIAASAEYSPVSTLRQKYGYAGQYDVYNGLAAEVMQAVEDV